MVEMVHFIPLKQRKMVLMAAQTDTAPTLIVGEEGTGKGAIAKWIHNNGPRASAPFVTVNPDDSIPELLPLANEGTLVIHDIDLRTLSEQKILLEFLNHRSIPHPANPEMPMILNVRIIVTTAQSLEGRTAAGLFKQDLLRKLNVFRIEMPDLKERGEEFEDIALGLLNEITRDLHKEHLRGISEEAWKALRKYEWPGNLRELRNVLKLAALAAKGALVEAQDLPDLNGNNTDLRATRESFERIYLQELLKTHHYQLEEACKISKIDKESLLQKLNKYGISLSLSEYV